MTVPYWSSTVCNGSDTPQKTVQILPTPYTSLQHAQSVAPLTVKQSWTSPVVSTPFLVKGRQCVPASSQGSADYKPPEVQQNRQVPQLLQQPITVLPGYTQQLKQMSMMAHTSQITYNQKQAQMLNVNHSTPKLQQIPNFVQIPTEGLHSKLIQHEPCIHTLRYLEAKVEKEKQIVKARADQMQALLQQSARQKIEILQLKQECDSKDHKIKALKSEIGGEHQMETNRAEVARLEAVIKGQREELDRLRTEEDKKRRSEQAFMVKLEEVNPQKVNGVRESRYPSQMVNIGEKQPNVEVNRLKNENIAFRLDIARLERENSEVYRLKLKRLNLNERLGKVTVSHLTSNTGPLMEGQKMSRQGPKFRNIPQVSYATSDQPPDKGIVNVSQRLQR